MEDDLVATQPAILPADRDEHVGKMHPLSILSSSKHFKQLSDLALLLNRKSAAFYASAASSIAKPLARLVRPMNCYYSNLIESHHTLPIDIERAQNNDYSDDPKKRDLQLEAIAHIKVQEWIDDEFKDAKPFISSDLALEIHRKFYENLPQSLHFVENPETKEKIEVFGGEYRKRDVKVGRHIPISPGAIPRFISDFNTHFHGLSKTEEIVNLGAFHHRFVWIHPFLDGNGRVARLLSHAQSLAFLGGGGLWSISRGLARNIENYKILLANCDQRRRNDYDGRGNLSEEELARFCEFFLKVSIDQVDYMEGLFNLKNLSQTLKNWTDSQISMKKLPKEAKDIIELILYRGQMPRSDIVGRYGERKASRINAELLKSGIVKSESHKSPLELNFSISFAQSIFPMLFAAN